MGLYMNPGNEAFKISVNDDIYIDQSGILAFTNNRIGKRKRYLCVSRPRRFGKSLTAEMLTAYYDRSCDSQSLFRGLEITKDESYEKNLNQYDVFSINIQQFLRGAGEPTRLVAYLEDQLLQELRIMYGELYDFPVEMFPAGNLPMVLSALFAKEEREKKGFIFIIDEWDCIFREAPEDKQAQKVYLDFLRDLLKDRTYVKLAYMTGILPVKKYGTHSALNIFDEFSMTEPKGLAKYIGFSEADVIDLCETYDMDFEEAKRWYDGYGFKQISHVYNPKSIVDAMLERSFQSYWVSTETYEALRVYIDMNFDGLRDAIIAMLGDLSCEIDTGTFQNDMTSFSGRDDVLTLLVHLGYLSYHEESHTVSIPNDEVRSEFLRAVKSSGWSEVVDAVKASEDLLYATLKMDAETVAGGIDAVHSASTSILSYNDENSLSCVITLAYYSAKKDYTLIRELPTGKGFADLVFLPRKHCNKPALLVELKWDRSVRGAMDQIKQQEYIQALNDYKGDLLLVGINYDKKSKIHQCSIEQFIYEK